MTTDEYQAVLDWDDYVKRAGELALKLVVNKSIRAIEVHEGDVRTEAVCAVKLEKLGAWLDGYDSACKYIAAERPMIEGVPIDIREGGDIWLVFNAERGGPSASVGLRKLVEGRDPAVVEAVANWSARVRTKCDDAKAEGAE